MACTCVVGLQWGDEAKGKIVDLLTDQHDIVVRYNGGANAVMCDGSVKYLKDSVGLNTIWALGSRAQGEVVSSDSY